MNKYLLALAVAVALGVTTSSNEAEARGFGGLHIQSGSVHVDVGRPHSYRSAYYGNGHRQVAYSNNYNRGYVQRPVQVYNRGHNVHQWGGHSTWHDTTHLDYHAPEIRRHGNHFDYTPGHYDVHRTGHFDHHDH